MWKAALTAGLLLLVVSLRFICVGAAVTVLMGGISVLAGGLPLRQYLRLLRIPLVFILLSVAAVIINISDREFAGLCIRLGDVYVGIAGQGPAQAAQLSVTALGAVSCLYFLALSTPVTDILYVLTKLRCPALLLELMLLIYRFIFVLLEMAHELGNAQKSRLGNRNLAVYIRSTGHLMAVLFLLSFQKSSRLYDAMESRCYDGHIRVLYEKK